MNISRFWAIIVNQGWQGQPDYLGPFLHELVALSICVVSPAKTDLILTWSKFSGGNIH